MRYRYIILMIMIAGFYACTENLEERITDSYSNGVPKKIEYYKQEGDSAVLVKQIRFYETGEKREEGSFSGDQRDGRWTYWFANGNKWSEANYKNGLRHGKSTVWFGNGNIRYSGSYIDGDTDGTWTYYADDGTKVKEVFFRKGEKVKEKSFE